MTRAEVEAVAVKIEDRANAREEEGASEQHEAEGMRIAVAMFREALAKSEAATPAPPTVTLFVSADLVAEFGNPISALRLLPQAGPGLWSVVSLMRIGGQPTYRIEVVRS